MQSAEALMIWQQWPCRLTIYSDKIGLPSLSCLTSHWDCSRLCRKAIQAFVCDPADKPFSNAPLCMLMLEARCGFRTTIPVIASSNLKCNCQSSTRLGATNASCSLLNQMGILTEAACFNQWNKMTAKGLQRMIIRIQMTWCAEPTM